MLAVNLIPGDSECQAGEQCHCMLCLGSKGLSQNYWESTEASLSAANLPICSAVRDK